MTARQSLPLDMLLIDRGGTTPLHRQLYQALKALIAERSLQPGTALPSSRGLAQDLGLARNTITAAYDQLVTEGYLDSHRGARPTVVDLPPGPVPSTAATAAGGPQVKSSRGQLLMRQPVHHGLPGQMIFHPGMPDADHFPFATWSRLLARRASYAGETLFGTYHVAGHPDLRTSVAAYLKTARGVICSPDQIIVTTGAQAALDLLARLLTDPGDTVWMEEPGYYGAQSAFIAAGARLEPLRVDATGWSLQPPPGRNLAAAYVTPSCHHPLGATMRQEQRLRLLEIAERQNFWIIEDDFDGEYRFQGQPIPAMQGSDTSNRVIYVGTFAKILFPALRLGFMVLPSPSLVAGVTRAISITGQFAPLLLQAALADFIEQGHMTRHLRRMRRIYAQRRQLFREKWAARMQPWGRLVLSEAGMQMVALLEPGLSDAGIALDCRARGVNVSPLSIQYHHADRIHGLLVGYAAANPIAMRRGFDVLFDVLSAANGASGRSPLSERN